MKKTRENYYKWLFLIAAVYDIILGVAFLFFWKFVYDFLNISYPEQPAYISLSAAFVLVIGVAYYMIYRNIYANRDLVKIGVFYKLAYFLVTVYYLFFSSVPHVVFLYFGIIDFIFLLLFVEFLSYTKKSGK